MGIKPLTVGEKVKSVHSLRLTAVVIKPVTLDKFTDGSYRYPEPREDAVYIKWDTDGTVGWTHSQNLKRIE